MKRSDAIIWMSDYGLWSECHLEAINRGISFNDLVAEMCGQYLKSKERFTTNSSLLLACKTGLAKEPKYGNIAEYMEMCCRKGLGKDEVVKQVSQSTLRSESHKAEKTEPKKKGSIFDLNRDVV